MRKNPVVSSDGAPLFTKKQLLQAKRFDYPVDVTQAVLEDGKLYTQDQAEALILDFYDRKVES